MWWYLPRAIARLKWEKASILYCITPSSLKSRTPGLAFILSYKPGDKNTNITPLYWAVESSWVPWTGPFSVGPWASCLTSQSLHSLIWWMGMTVKGSPTSWQWWPAIAIASVLKAENTILWKPYEDSSCHAEVLCPPSLPPSIPLLSAKEQKLLLTDTRSDHCQRKLNF